MRETIGAEPFAVDISEAVLADLRERLGRTRWPAHRAGTGWHYGTEDSYLRALLAHWRDAYDWRADERALNRFRHYRADVDGRRVHFILERGSGENPMPLVLTNGWPGTFAEYADVIEPLAHPERFGGDVRDAFTVIVPSLPGYAFSDPPPEPQGPRQVAATWHKLMKDVLGCSLYGAHGSDWGSAISAWLAFDFPGPVAAIHLTGAPLLPHVPPEAPPLQADEKTWLERRPQILARETGYQAIQGTKPNSLAYGLTDSPAGLAAWVIEKYQVWTRPGTDEPPPFTFNRLCAALTLMWAHGLPTSTWIYTAIADGTAFALPPGGRIETPTGFCMFPGDLFPPAPSAWLSRAYNLVHRTDAPRGGHFPASEVPQILIDDLRRFFATHRA